MILKALATLYRLTLIARPTTIDVGHEHDVPHETAMCGLVSPATLLCGLQCLCRQNTLGYILLLASVSKQLRIPNTHLLSLYVATYAVGGYFPG